MDAATEFPLLSGDEGFVVPTWLDTRRLVELCLQDDRVKEVLAGQKVSRSGLNALLSEIFEEVYLVEVLSRWEEAREDVGRWLALHCRHYRDEHGDLKQAEARSPSHRWGKVDPDKKYCWTCQDCRAVHYYPVVRCCRCGKSRIKQAETDRPLGLPGRKLLARR